MNTNGRSQLHESPISHKASSRREVGAHSRGSNAVRASGPYADKSWPLSLGLGHPGTRAWRSKVRPDEIFWQSSSTERIRADRLGCSDARPTVCKKPRYSQLPEPWHFREGLLQLPGSASSPSGPMQVCVYMHQNKPSLHGGTVWSRSASMKSPFQRSAEHR